MAQQIPTVEAVTGQKSQQGGPEASPAEDTRSPYDSLPCKLPPVPDVNNNRFCRACRASLHVDAFPPGKRGYLCRRHTWLRNEKPSMDRALADPRKKLLRVLWRRRWVDAKKAFGHTRIALLQRDIAKALSGFDFGDERSQCHERYAQVDPGRGVPLV